jgi:hypothetical protein
VFHGTTPNFLYLFTQRQFHNTIATDGFLARLLFWLHGLVAHEVSKIAFGNAGVATWDNVPLFGAENTLSLAFVEFVDCSRWKLRTDIGH